MKWAVIPALLLAGAVPAGAQPPRPTIQQQFDAASAAREAQNWAEALSQFEALEARVRIPRTLALIKVRKGTVLVELGRLDEAAASIRAGLPGLAADDDTLTLDRFLGFSTLGRIAEHALDYPEALRQYRLAAALPVTDAERILIQRGIIQTQLFTDVAGALRDADAALTMATAAAPGNRTLEGEFHTLRGRALLNLGRFADARTELELSMRLLGNLTQRVDRADLIARSDLAIAAALAGDASAAQRYLAYTGAGRFERGDIRYNDRNRAPGCGAAIRPEDVAVVELFVGANGNVISAMPVYASRQGPAAIAFARAAESWWFNPQVTSGVPALFRSVVRIEMRCAMSETEAGSNDDDITAYALGGTDPYLKRAATDRANRPADSIRAELAALERGPSPASREVLALLLVLGDHIQIPHPEREAYLRRALPMAAALDAAPQLLARIAVLAATQHAAPRQAGGSYDALDYAAILALPEIVRSPRAAAWVRLSQARFLYHQGKYGEALAATAAVLAAPDNRARMYALEVEVATHAARGDIAAARTTYATIGPDADRCGISPRQRQTRAGSGDFPDLAYQWGFEGWALNEMSIAPDGHVAGSRTIAAYPPFVFDEASRRVTDRNRYEPIYIPDGQPCPLDTGAVRFALPR